ncbi:predicted protein [Arabidopsis lyrata subsp. lyrata]|uniref:Predicted protein n=1 Tax=Arabidopsis lyrata subsp. lyrata TaxID=81972 RepID=D7M6A4_ARALL|nr:predicted protein [Arabidopsis lyrata subsp. lyrata]
MPVEPDAKINKKKNLIHLSRRHRFRSLADEPQFPATLNSRHKPFAPPLSL